MTRKSTLAMRKRNAALRTIERHEALVLSEADRKAFFDALMTPPHANERLAKAFAAARRRVS